MEGNNLNNSFKVNNWVKNFIALFLKHLSLKCDSLLQLHPFTDQQCMGQWADGGVGVGLSQPPWAPLEHSKTGIAQHFGAAVVGSGSEMPHKGTCLFLCSSREGFGRTSLQAWNPPGIILENCMQAEEWGKEESQNNAQTFSPNIQGGTHECPKGIWSSRREHLQEKGFVQQSLFFPSYISRPHIKAMAPLQTSSALGRDKDDKGLGQLKSSIMSSVFKHFS